jgi:muconolactone delta-isomerase
MAQFIVMLRRDLDRFGESDFAPLLEPEAEQARRLYTGGQLRTIWGRKDAPGAVLIFEAADEAEARRFAGTLPLVEKGMMIVDAFCELGPYRGFAPRGS